MMLRLMYVGWIIAITGGVLAVVFDDPGATPAGITAVIGLALIGAALPWVMYKADL